MNKINICGKVILKHKDYDDSVLILKRPAYDCYEPIGGRLEIDFENQKSETIEDCIQRECLEEVGLSIENLTYIGSYNYFWEKNGHYNFCLLYTAFINSSLENLKKEDGFGKCLTISEWVLKKDLLSNDRVKFNPTHFGLNCLIEKFCSQQ
jgi:8-oxo-dGTP pyrophosphatase MutT (NUDIX family)